MRKKVLFFVNSGLMGGGNIAILRFIDKWNEDRYEAYVILPGLGLSPMSAELEKRGIAYEIWSPYKFSNIIFFVRYLFKTISLIFCKKIDLVWANSPYTFQFCGFAAKICGIPSICYFHYPPDEYETKRSFLQFSSRIITCCESIRKGLITTMGGLINPLKVVKISNFVDTRSFYPAVDPEAAKKKFGIDSSQTVITLVGHLSFVKGHSIFLNAIGALSKKGYLFLAVLAGEDKDNDRRNELAIKEQITHLDLEKKVWMMGFQKDILSVLHMTDIFVLPSLKEGLSLVLLEAAACGLPIIATDIQGTPELIVAGDTGILIPPNDPLALEGAIEKLLLDPEKRRRMGANARMRVEERYSISMYVKNMEGVMEGLLKKS